MRIAIVVVVVVALYVWMGLRLSDKQAECEDKGGVYLLREYECVKGID